VPALALSRRPASISTFPSVSPPSPDALGLRLAAGIGLTRHPVGDEIARAVRAIARRLPAAWRIGRLLDSGAR
jgi:hypothetical protein